MAGRLDVVDRRSAVSPNTIDTFEIKAFDLASGPPNEDQGQKNS